MRAATRLVVPALLAVAFAGCAGPEASLSGPTPVADPGACMSFTNAVGVVGMARYEDVRDWARIHEDLERAGFGMHPDPTAVAGRDPAGDPFSMTSTGTYEVRYPWNGSEPWPSDAGSARANAYWQASAPRYDASVRAFENATGMRAVERSWRPDLMSGIACA